MSRESSCTTYFRTTPNMVKKDQLTCLCSDPKSVNDPVKDAEYLMAILKIHKVWIGSFRNPESSAFGCPSFQQAAETYGNKWTPFSNYEYNQGLSRGADAVCAASHPSSTTDLKTFTMWWKVWNGKVSMHCPSVYWGWSLNTVEYTNSLSRLRGRTVFLRAHEDFTYEYTMVALGNWRRQWTFCPNAVYWKV